jgi:hypothetical protein
VGQLVERPLDAEVRGERQRENEGVRREVAAAVIADQQHRPVGGNPLETAHVGPEVERRQQPQPRQLLADVVRVSLVEIGLGHPGTHLMLGPLENVAQPGHIRNIDSGRLSETCVPT